MQEDKVLKELLLKGCEKAPPTFTNNVMKGIVRNRYINEPLISRRWVRIYRMVYLTLVSLLILATLLMKISSMQFNINLQLPDIYIENTDTIIIYIIAFWALVFLSQKLNSKTKIT